MRVTSEFFVAALVRRANDAGAFAVVERRGAAEAGAIFVVVDDRSGSSMLYGPAMAGLGREERARDADARRFEAIDRFAPSELRERFKREASFDPDFWVVEVDDREGRHFLGEALVDGD